MSKVISVDNYGVYKIAFPNTKFVVLRLTAFNDDDTQEDIIEKVNDAVKGVDRNSCIILKTEKISPSFVAVLDALFVQGMTVLIDSNNITADDICKEKLGTSMYRAEAIKLPGLSFIDYKDELLTKLVPIGFANEDSVPFFLMSGTDLSSENQLRDRLNCLKTYIEQDVNTCLIDCNKATVNSETKIHITKDTCNDIYNGTKDLRYKYAFLRLYDYLIDNNISSVELLKVDIASLINYLNQLIGSANAGDKRMYLIQPNLEAFYAAMLVSIVQNVAVAVVDYEKRYTAFPFCNEVDFSFSLSEEPVQSFGAELVSTFSTDTYKAKEALKSRIESLNEDSILHPVLLKFTLEDLITYWNTPYTLRPGYSRDSYTINAPVLFGVLEGVCVEGVKATKKLYNKLFQDCQYVYYDDLGLSSLNITPDKSDAMLNPISTILHSAIQGNTHKEDISEAINEAWSGGVNTKCTITETDFIGIMANLNSDMCMSTVKKLYSVYLTLNKITRSIPEYITAIDFELAIYIACASLHKQLASSLEDFEGHRGRVIIYKGDAIPLTGEEYVYTNVLALLGFDVLIISPRIKGIIDNQHSCLNLSNKLTLGKTDPDFTYRYKPSLISRMVAKSI